MSRGPHVVILATAAAFPASAVAARPAPIGFGVIAATLAAAVLHAIWNAIAHGISDRPIGFALIGVAYTGVSAVVVAITGPPPAGAWVFILASAGAHVAYQLLLFGWLFLPQGPACPSSPPGVAAAPYRANSTVSSASA